MNIVLRKYFYKNLNIQVEENCIKVQQTMDNRTEELKNIYIGDLNTFIKKLGKGIKRENDFELDFIKLFEDQIIFTFQTGEKTKQFQLQPQDLHRFLNTLLYCLPHSLTFITNEEFVCKIARLSSFVHSSFPAKSGASKFLTDFKTGKSTLLKDFLAHEGGVNAAANADGAATECQKLTLCNDSAFAKLALFYQDTLEALVELRYLLSATA